MDYQEERRGGKRNGAGRPRGSKKDPTKRISLPADVVEYLQQPEAIPSIRVLIAKRRY